MAEAYNLIQQYNQIADEVGELEAYKLFTKTTGLYPEGGTGSLVAVTYCALGLGEAGEVQGKVKKIWRDAHGKISEQVRRELLLELGDLLWYTVRMADELGYTFEEIIQENVRKLADRRERNAIKGDGDHR